MLNRTLIIATTLALLGLAGCSKEEKLEQVEVIRPAKLIKITASTDVKNFSFPAVVEALSSKDLTFQVSGQIEKFNVIEGQSVKQGDIIATLVQRTFQNELNTAQAQFENAKIEFERGQRLIVENAISKSVFEQRKSQFNVASSQYDNAKKAMEDTILRSPFEGVVAIKHAEELEVINPSAPIVTLQTEGAAEAAFKIPASLVARSKQIVPISTIIVLDSAPQYEMKGEFVSVTAKADEKSQTFDIKFGFTPPENLTILPGMTGVVKSSLRIPSEEGKIGQITVPLYAVLSDSSGQFVWKVDVASMTVTKQNIEVGTGVGESLVVNSGLEDGDTIVGAGTSYLSEGMKIRALKQ